MPLPGTGLNQNAQDRFAGCMAPAAREGRKTAISGMVVAQRTPPMPRVINELARLCEVSIESSLEAVGNRKSPIDLAVKESIAELCPPPGDRQ
jgi:hypothetical protein